MRKHDLNNILTIFLEFSQFWQFWKAWQIWFFMKFLTIFYFILTIFAILTIAKTILDTCDICDTDYNSDSWEPEFTTIIVTWQLSVRVDRTLFVFFAMFNMSNYLLSLFMFIVQPSFFSSLKETAKDLEPPRGQSFRDKDSGRLPKGGREGGNKPSHKQSNKVSTSIKQTNKQRQWQTNKQRQWQVAQGREGGREGEINPPINSQTQSKHIHQTGETNNFGHISSIAC